MTALPRQPEWVCPKCGNVMPGPNMLCSGSFTDIDHPSNVKPRLREEQSWPAPEDQRHA